MSAAIVGIGTWLPEQIRTNADWPPSFGLHEHSAGDRTFNDIPPSEDEVSAAIVARDLAAEASDPFLGAVRRHIADSTTSAADAETLAAQRALDDAGIDGSDVDLVLSNSLVPERISLATGCMVSERIGARRALALGIEATCASGVTQVEVARAYVESGLAKVVLLTNSHLLLRAMPMAHPATPGLGDAATAVVIARGKGLTLRSTFGRTHGEYARAVNWVRGINDDVDLPWWKAGGDFRLGSRAPEQVKFLMRETVSFGATTLREAAARASIDVQRISVLASVQPRGFLPAAIAERLGLPRACAVTTYDEVAHIGVCGPFFNLAHARKLGLLEPGAIVAMYGQGAGFTRSAALLEVTH